MMTITKIAEENILAAMEAEKRQGDVLRISVQRGGTPQVQYDLSFAPGSSKAPNDLLLDIGPVKVLIDNQSALYLKGAIVDYIHDLHGGGFKISNPNAPAAAIPNLNSPVAKTIQKLIEEKINPGVAGHGGHVELVDVKETSVYLRLGGGCQGCGMANVTLKQGIEVMIKEAVPAITSVLDVTDHAGGNNPYYQPSK
ncbi:MAG: iron-sulfur cluster assembly accessory protein [Nitrospiria bacterium]